MKVLQDIAKLLDCSLEVAQQVRDYMEDWLNIDYSACTTKEFNKTVRLAHEMMPAGYESEDAE